MWTAPARRTCFDVSASWLSAPKNAIDKEFQRNHHPELQSGAGFPAPPCTLVVPPNGAASSGGLRDLHYPEVAMAGPCGFPSWLGFGRGGSPCRLTTNQEPLAAFLAVSLVAETAQLPPDRSRRNPPVNGDYRIHNLLFSHPAIADHGLSYDLREKPAGRAGAPVLVSDNGEGRLRGPRNWNLSRFQDSVTHCRAAIAAAGLVDF